jgi:HAD superfamily hydrolase (TIGR01509 family)
VVVQTVDFDACLFDMDGTLIDTEPYWIEAESLLVEQHGGHWSAKQGLALVGSGLYGTADALQRAGVDMETRAIIDWLSDYVRGKMAQQMPWRPGAVDLIRTLHQAGIPCALVTMSFRPTAFALRDAMSEELGTDAFQVVVTGEDVTYPKPHPEAYLQAADTLGVSIERCVAFEDSGHGAASAFSAGAITIGLPLHVDIPDHSVHVLWDSLQNKTLADIHTVAVAGRAQ